MTDHPYPLDANGMYIDPRGTKWTERDEQRIRDRRAAEIAQAVAEREAREAQSAVDRERVRREDGQQRLEAYRAASLERWLDNGGTESGFGSAWPSLRDKWLTAQLGDHVAADVARLRARPEYQI